MDVIKLKYATIGALGLALACAQACCIGQTYKAYELVPGEPDGYRLQIKEHAFKQPPPSAALLRVYAVALNRRDIQMAARHHAPGDTLSTIPVTDGAGEVVALGTDVHRFRVGDRVIATFIRGWAGGRRSPDWAETHGMLAQYVIVDEQDLVKVPRGMKFAEAATLPSAGLTAWNGLFGQKKVLSGDYVLIEGTSDVAIFGVQFAVAAGAKPIVVAENQARLTRSKELGAVAAINYMKTPDWVVAVKEEITHGVGVNHVLWMGNPQWLLDAVHGLASDSQIAIADWVGGTSMNVPMKALIGSEASIGYFLNGSRSDFERMNAFIDQHGIVPVIDRVYAFEDAPEAYDYLEKNDVFGKVVISIEAGTRADRLQSRAKAPALH